MHFNHSNHHFPYIHGISGPNVHQHCVDIYFTGYALGAARQLAGTSGPICVVQTAQQRSSGQEFNDA